jgi:hypothetical protein
MFARWLFVRLHAAEKALRDGRIDDAYAAAAKPEHRADPRWQQLLDELVKPLVARARLARQGGRYDAALADLDKVTALGRGGPDVDVLRQEIAVELRQHVERDADRRAAAGRVAEHLDAGRLETGRLNVQRVDDPRQRAELAEELDIRVQRSAQLLQQATAALERDDVLAAVRYWHEACERHGRTRDSDTFAARLGAACRKAIETWVDDGRMDCLVAARSGVGALLPMEPTLAESDRVVGLCMRAVSQFSAADYSGLRQTLLRLKAARGKVSWVEGALKALAGIVEGQDALLASPLGLYVTTAEPAARRASPTGHTDTAAGAIAAPDALRIDRPLLMLVDGGGSCLLVHEDRVRIGRAGSSMTVEVPVPGDLQSHHADVVRHGEDYFLTAYGPVEVNHRRVTHTLLRDGDRIALGGQAKMVFCKPSAKSESAVLRLSHRCRLPQDVGDVVLFRQTCLIGPTESCHLRTHDSQGQVVLFERGGGLHARPTAGPAWQSSPSRPVRTGETMEFGELRLTVKPYELRGWSAEA